MFAYCNNNGVSFVDSNGRYPLTSVIYPNAKRSDDSGEWLLETDEEEREEKGELTLAEKTKRFQKLMRNNLEFSIGIGMGFELSANLFEVAELGLGMHGDVLCVRLEDGEFKYGSDYSAGVAISALFHNFGFVESQFNENYEYGTLEANKGFWADESLTVEASCYCLLGLHLSIGFDIVTFCEEWNNTFK